MSVGNDTMPNHKLIRLSIALVWLYEGRDYPQIGLNAVAGKAPKLFGTIPLPNLIPIDAITKLVDERLPHLHRRADAVDQDQRVAIADVAALHADPLTARGDVQLINDCVAGVHADAPLSTAHCANHCRACG